MANQINPADFAGNFIEEAEPYYTPRGFKKDGSVQYAKRRQVKLRCLNKKCNKEFIVDYSNAKRIKQQCCCHSCFQEMNFHFGIPNEKHPLYKRWLSMTQRCRTPSHNMYYRYGARGITIEPYLQDFINYAEYVLSLPNAPKQFPTKLQIDRINNNGNYERGNLRWVTCSENNANSEKQKKIHPDKYIGVNWSIRKKQYCVRLRHNGKSVYLGWFKDELEGAKVREDYIKKHNLTNRLNNV